MKLTCEYAKSDFEVPPLSAGGTYTINIIPKEDFSESSMTIYYIDKDGKKHEELVVGYFEKGYNGYATITLISIDKNDVIKMEVKSEV